VTSGGLVATVGEVGLLHFRGAYHNPAMFLPVGVPPLASMLLANAALGSRPSRWWKFGCGEVGHGSCGRGVTSSNSAMPSI
jgi:hypothetical protein